MKEHSNFGYYLEGAYVISTRESDKHLDIQTVKIPRLVLACVFTGKAYIPLFTTHEVMSNFSQST